MGVILQNAGTEVFVRNWRETVVRIAVRDSRVREKDPLLGVINIDLEELFNNSKTSQVTQLFSLQDGVGFGRAQVSLLFQPVDADLPKNLLGWDTATLEILSPLTLEVADEKAHELGKKKLSIITSEDTLKVSPRAATIDGGRVTWKVKDNGEPLRLPLFERYKSAVAFQIGSPDVLAVLWLQTMVDEEEKEIRIPLIAGKRLKRLRQHFVNDRESSVVDGLKGSRLTDFYCRAEKDARLRNCRLPPLSRAPRPRTGPGSRQVRQRVGCPAAHLRSLRQHRRASRASRPQLARQR